MPSLSKKSGLVLQSEIRAMSIACDNMGGINLAQGICDTEVPPEVALGAQRAITDGINTYTKYDGLSELRNQIAIKLENYNNIKALADSEIIVTSGSTGAFLSACLTLLDPGDEVIVFEPYYGYHITTIKAAGAVPVFVTLEPPNWTFSKSSLSKAISNKTKAIVVCTPSNPSGKVFTAEEIKEIARLSIEHDFFIFTDEIYEYFVYDGLSHLSPAHLPEIRDRTITISGYSKTYSITGWRIGYSVSHEKWAKMIGFMSDLIYVCAPSPLQKGVSEGIASIPVAYYTKLRDEYARKRIKICNSLEHAGLTPYIPQGSYYVLASTGNLPGATSKEKAMHLLNTTGVASVPGQAFFNGTGGDNLLRFCFAKTDQDLDEACQRLEKLT